ncbi:hypothetical protein AZE42_12730 [Rhizopogon vesiculosus]|uniref:Uncharacterized protein n=1 Tax=Rhizopogon vesiculosus TaxID=180088 RepID=A0A1J8R4Q3_9AGAM|nr:hypothetical protein AZE42_12730 [Rhizopogon vesiculosus]
MEFQRFKAGHEYVEEGPMGEMPDYLAWRASFYTRVEARPPKRGGSRLYLPISTSLMKTKTRQLVLTSMQLLCLKQKKGGEWVLTWVCLRFKNGELKGRLLNEWLKVDAIGCREKKHDFVDDGRFNAQPTSLLLPFTPITVTVRLITVTAPHITVTVRHIAVTIHHITVPDQSTKPSLLTHHRHNYYDDHQGLDATECERSCNSEASQNAHLGMITRMQFTVSIDTPPRSFPAMSSSSYTFSSEGSTATATSESYFGYTIDDTVVTIPTYF